MRNLRSKRTAAILPSCQQPGVDRSRLDNYVRERQQLKRHSASGLEILAPPASDCDCIENMVLKEVIKVTQCNKRRS